MGHKGGRGCIHRDAGGEPGERETKMLRTLDGYFGVGEEHRAERIGSREPSVGGNLLKALENVVYAARRERQKIDRLCF